MKRNSPNPKIIGAFVTVMLGLIVALTLYFGTTNFLNQSTHFILFFDQSVNGLQVGSQVKFRGVPIGSVKAIKIRSEGQRTNSTAIPVIIEINRSRLQNELGASSTTFSPESIQESLDQGLLAQLNLESIITGQLFVELSFEPDKAVNTRRHLEEKGKIYEIPTLSSSLDQITADLAQIIADFEELDLGLLADNINELLVSARETLDGIDSEGISTSVTDAADQITDFIASKEFRQSVTAMRGAFEEARDTAKSFNLREGPLAETVDTWTVRITETLDSLDQLTADANSLLKPGSDLRYEFETLFRELGRTARAIRLLSEYLERNPNALITGRSEEE